MYTGVLAFPHIEMRPRRGRDSILPPRIQQRYAKATTADWLNDGTSTRKLLANVQRNAKVCTREADKSSSTSEAKRQKAKDELAREHARLAHLL